MRGHWQSGIRKGGIQCRQRHAGTEFIVDFTSIITFWILPCARLPKVPFPCVSPSRSLHSMSVDYGIKYFIHLPRPVSRLGKHNCSGTESFNLDSCSGDKVGFAQMVNMRLHYHHIRPTLSLFLLFCTSL